MARHLAVGNCFGRFLKFEDLKVDAFTLVWYDEVRVDRTFDLTRLCTEEQQSINEWLQKGVTLQVLLVALSWQRVSLQTGFDRVVVEKCLAGATLESQTRGFRADCGRSNDDTWYLHQA